MSIHIRRISSACFIALIAAPAGFGAWQPHFTRLKPRAIEIEDAGSRRDSSASVPDAEDPYRPSAGDVVGQIPLHFEMNMGQADPQVLFQARGRGYGIFVTHTETVLSLGGIDIGQLGSGREGTATVVESAGDGLSATNQSAIRIRFVGSSAPSGVSGELPLEGKANYFRGNDASQWVTDVPTFARVRSRDVYPGIDVVHYGNQKELEYDVVVAPGADPQAIRLDIEGADRMESDANGDLLVHVGGLTLRQKKPSVYQMVDGARTPIASAYVINADGTVGFRVAEYDPTLVLVIDPVIVYSTFLGGSMSPATATRDEIFAVATDAAGNIYVTGFTDAGDYPTTASPIAARNQGGLDVVVTKFNPTGSSLLYSTYLGGGADDRGFGITVDNAGSAFVFGDTAASTVNFPTTATAFQRQNAGIVDVFVTKLSPDGSSLVYSTLLGGSGVDRSNASQPGGFITTGGDPVAGATIKVDATGAAYVTGETADATIDFPTTSGALDTSHNGVADAFVAKINPDGSGLDYSTFIGGTGYDRGNNLDILDLSPADDQYDVFVAGTTLSSNFPTESPILGYANNEDGFALRLNATGTGLVYSTFINGNNNGDYCVGVAVDASGAAYFGGHTSSTTFNATTGGAYQTTTGGLYDAFVVKLGPTGALMNGTLLGGAASEQLFSGIALSPGGQVCVPIRSGATNLTTAGSYDGSFNGDVDVVLVRVNSNLSGPLNYGTYLGGPGADEPRGITVLPGGDIVVVGITTAAGFPTKLAFDGAYGGGTDGFVARLNPGGLGEPDLVFSTLLNGSQGTSSAELASSIALGPDNSMFIAGSTATLDFPTINGSGPSGNFDAFVTKLSPSGASIVYSTYIGGSSQDFAATGLTGGRALAVDATGTAYLVGTTSSSDFPRSIGPVFAGGSDAYVLRLAPAGNSLLFSRFIGGSVVDFGNAIALEKNPAMGQDPRIYIGGTTLSANFPLVGAIDSTVSQEDGYVVRLDPTGVTLEYSTLWGGSEFDGLYDIDVDVDGAMYVCMTSNSSLPVSPGAVDLSNDNYYEPYLMKLDPIGTRNWSTWLGGSLDDRPYFGLRVDASKNVYVAGYTEKTSSRLTDFPTPSGVNSYDRLHNGGYDLFVAKVNPTGTALLYSTFLGGNLDEFAYGSINIDTIGNVYLAALTNGTGFPTTLDAPDRTQNGSADAVVCKIDTNVNGAASLRFSTFWGGSGSDIGYAATVDAAGKIYVAGSTNSLNFPTGGTPVTPTLQGIQDAFIATFQICPNITSVTTSPSNGAIYAGGSATISVNATSDSTISYAWFQRLPDTTVVPAPGVNDQATYSTGPLSDSSTFFVRATSTCLTVPTSADSANIPITVCTQPAIIAPIAVIPPAAATTGVAEGTQVMLTVTATGSGLTCPLCTPYQWYLGQSGDTSQPIGSPTASATFTFAPADSASYWVRVSGSCALQLQPVDSPTVNITVLRAPIVVNSLADSGLGSLRQAIDDANSDPDRDTITFALAGTISLASQLPVITAPVTIDGGGTPGVPVVELNGTSAGGATVDCAMDDAGAGADGLHVAAAGAGTLIRGLVINGFTGDGIEFEGGGSPQDQSRVQGCFIGTNLVGTLPILNGRHGIFINNASNCIVGGDRNANGSLRDGCLISGNVCSGIEIRGGLGANNVVIGSNIGPNLSGTSAIGNGTGIRIDGAPQNRIGAAGDDASKKNQVGYNNGGGVVNSGTVNTDPQGTPPDTQILGTVFTGNGMGAIVGGVGNAPMLTAASINETTLLVVGTAQVQPNKQYRVQYFGNTTCTASGQGEYLLAASVLKMSTPGGVLDLTFASSATTVRPGELVAVTVTGNEGTSNFSVCQPVVGRLASVAELASTVAFSSLPAGPMSGREGSSSKLTDPPSPSLQASFAGPGDPDNPDVAMDEALPPDPQGAVGPSHLLAVTNERIAIQQKTDGVVLDSAPLDSLFASLKRTPLETLLAFNPRALYDPYGQRFVVAATANPKEKNSAVLVAISQTSDPLGTWNVYRYDAEGADILWADYPTLGFTKDWIAVQVNMSSIAFADQIVRSEVYLIDKTAAYAGNPGNGKLTILGSASIGRTQVPALTYDAGLGTLYLLQTGQGNEGGFGKLNSYLISGAVGSESLTTGPEYVTTKTWLTPMLTPPDLAPQLGSAAKIAVNDTRMHSVVYRSGRLYAAHTVLLPDAGPTPTLSGVQWYELNPSNGTVVQEGRVADDNGLVFYAFPALAVSAPGNVVLGYSRFSPDTFASAAYRYRRAEDPTGTMGDEQLLKAGLAPYFKNLGSGPNRWGDYSMVAVDPSDGETFWLFNEYAAVPRVGTTATSDQWGTWWGSIAPVGTCTVTCPSNITVQTGGGAPGCAMTVNYAAPTVSGACGTVTCNPASGSSFPVGVTTVTCSDGGIHNCSFTVTVQDNTVPQFTTCPGPQTVAAASNCQATVPNLVAMAVASDNCPGVVITQSPAPGTLIGLVVQQVTLTATDAAGNTATCPVSVTVEDQTAPSISCPSNITMAAAAGACSRVVNFPLTVSDNCPGGITVTTSQPSGSEFVVGTTMVTVTATDLAGNSASCQFAVTIQDVTAPTIGCPSNIQTAALTTAGRAVSFTPPVATDSCGSSVACVPAPGSTFAIGTTTVTCTATDGANNSTNCQFAVEVGPLGSDTVGVYVPTSGAWFLRNANSPGGADLVFGYGPPSLGLIALRGDWDGNGSDTAGLYDPVNGFFFLKNTNAPGGADLVYGFGPPGLGWKPLVGDWNGDGVDTVGLYDPANGFFFLRNAHAAGAADLVYGFGPPGAGLTPLVGDWDGNASDTVGLYDPAFGNFFLRNSHAAGGADLVYGFGPAGLGWEPLAGDWNADGADTVGLYDGPTGFFFLRDVHAPGAADAVFGYGPANATPIVGDWNGQ